MISLQDFSPYTSETLKSFQLADVLQIISCVTFIPLMKSQGPERLPVLLSSMQLAYDTCKMYIHARWYIHPSFPGGSEGRACACKSGDLSSIPESGRSPEKEMATHSDTLAWKIPWIEEPGAGYSLWGCKELDMTKWLHFHFHFHFYRQDEKLCLLTFGLVVSLLKDGRNYRR